MVQACPVRGPDVVNTKDHSLPATVILGAETPWRASGDNEAAAASKKREPALDTYSLLKGKMDAHTSNMSERWLGLLSRLLIGGFWRSSQQEVADQFDRLLER